MIKMCKNLKVSTIIPAHNEEEYIENTIKSVKKVDEVLVVNDGSSDRTAEISKKLLTKLISLPKNKGKGFAMKMGSKNANGDILIFIDADLKNLTSKKITKILNPFKEGYDFVKTRFDRRKGRVTRLTANPLLGHFFPEIAKRFEQPLSGQIGIRKEVIRKLDLEDDLGVDIGILIDVVEMNVKIKEVYFGWLDHNEKELKELDEMAKVVSRVILDKAASYGRINKTIKEIQS